MDSDIDLVGCVIKGLGALIVIGLVVALWKGCLA